MQPIQPGTVLFWHNPHICSYKSGGDYSNQSMMKHPHVVIELIENDTKAILLPLTSQGDCLHEKNVHHFIPAEAAKGMLYKPSWVLPHIPELIVSVSALSQVNNCLLNPVAMEIIWNYIDIYDSDWKVNKADAFIPFAGCNYPWTEVKHFDVTTADVYEDLGMDPVTLQELLPSKVAAFAC